jgi:hypothetical protein
MTADTRILIGRIYTHLFPLNIGDYLSSDQFSLFCKNHDLEDTWKQYLVESQDRPDLYGAGVIKNAFTLFLHHVFHSRHEEFPAMLTDFLNSISNWASHPLPVDELKRDLRKLGYSDSEIENTFLTF